MLQMIGAVAVTALIVLAGAFIGSWLGGLANTALQRRSIDPAIRRLLVQFVQPVVIALSAVAAFDYLGLDLSAVAFLLGAAGIGVGLALKGSMSNVASGGILLTLRPIHEGEFVKVAGQKGTVVSQGLFTTTLKTAQGTHVEIPNDLVLAAPVENYSRNGTRRIDVEVLLPPKADLRKAITALVDVAIKEPHVLEEPAPRADVSSPSPLGVPVVVKAWVSTDDFTAVQTGLVTNVMAMLKSKRFNVVTPEPRVES
jgi:small conductance mechanosensitive channel